MRNHAKPPSPRWISSCRPLLLALPLLTIQPALADYSAPSGSIVTEAVTLTEESAFIGGATLTGNVTLVSGNNTVVADAVANTIISGPISGAGNLIKTGPTKLVLSGSNSYTGTTTISNGVLDVAPGGNLGSGAIINNSLLTFSTNSPIALSGVSGVGSITVGGSGGLTLTGNNTMSGTINMSRGSLVINGSHGGSIVMGAGGTVNVTGNVTGSTSTLANVTTNATGSLGAVSFGANNIATINGATGALTTGANSTVTVNGDMGGNVSVSSGAYFTVTGNITGSLTLAANSVASLNATTVTGNTTLSTGSLIGTGALGGTTTISSGGVYSTLVANFTFNNISWVTNSTTAGLVVSLDSHVPITIAGSFNRSSTTATNRYIIDFNGTGIEGTTYELLTFGSSNFTTALNTLQAVNLAPEKTAVFSTADNKLYVTVVPEPSEYALMFGVFLAVVIAARMRARRRQATQVL